MPKITIISLPNQVNKYKSGGKHWIPKHLKKGRCTPAPNPDCPKGSPQYNLAMTFKKHHGFHADGGTQVDPLNPNYINQVDYNQPQIPLVNTYQTPELPKTSTDPYNPYADWTNYAKVAPTVYNAVQGMRKAQQVPENKFSINATAQFRPIDRASLYNKINSERLAGINNITNIANGAGAQQLANQQGLSANAMNARYNTDLQAQVQDESRRQYIENQRLGVNQYNSQNARENYLMNQQALARRRSFQGAAAQGLGNIAMDTKYNRLEQSKLNLIPQIYPQLNYLAPNFMNILGNQPQI